MTTLMTRAVGDGRDRVPAASRLDVRVGCGDREEDRVVAGRTEAFARELQASGALGLVLARRAAVLSVRMERLAARDVVAGRAAEGAALAAFDADRASASAALLAEAAATADDPGAALGALAQLPDGLERLIGAWRDLLGRLRGANPAAAVEQAARWLGRSADKSESGRSVVELGRRVTAEVARLETRRGTMGDAERAIAAARADAGRLARFDPGPEATLARRDEAAAERGMYRAIRTIATLNREAGRGGAEVDLGVEWQTALDQLGRTMPPTLPPEPGAAPEPLASFRAGEQEPLASFRAGENPPLASFGVGVIPAPEPGPPRPIDLDPGAGGGRSRRPDLRKLAGSRR